MAVIVSNGPTNLSATGGFYRAESYNLSPMSTTKLLIVAPQYIPVTFANAGNCQGLIIYMVSGSSTRAVTVTLQEYVAGVWTDRTSVTRTNASLINSTTNSTYGTWIRDFVFGTPYAVDTSASKWRFKVEQGAGSNTWNIRTSNGTAPAYITWCDNAVTYATNDVIIAKDKVTIDRTCRFNGELSTGDSVNSICAVLCSGSTGDYNNNGMLVWENPPTASYTMTISGIVMMGAHSGFHVGTSANRIPTAKKAVIEIAAAVAGTSTISGFYGGGNNNDAPSSGRANLQLYGEIPAVRSTTISAEAAASQPNIVTTDVTGWAVGDKLGIGKATVSGALTETVPYEITSISGTNIAVTPNIRNYARRAGGHVIRLNGYGVELTNTHTAVMTSFIHSANNIVISGVQESGASFSFSGSSYWYDDNSNIGTIAVEDNSGTNGGVSNVTFLTNLDFADKPISISRNHLFKTTLLNTIYGTKSAAKTVDSNIFMSSQVSGFYWSRKFIITNNICYNNVGAFFSNSSGLYNSLFENNYFWGSTYSAYRTDGTSAGLIFRNNVYERMPRGIWSLSSMIDCRFINEKFSLEENVAFPIFAAHASYPSYMRVVFDTPQLNTNVTPSSFDETMVDNSQVSFQNYNQVDKVDFTHMPYGKVYRTGAGLADTTVRTAGGYAMRFEPTMTPEIMHWEQSVPIGDIQNKTMTISCWVKINNSAYWAGTHVKPTLTVDYDNGTSVTKTATATTDWQRLDLTITPATTFGQIDIRVSGATDATAGANSYFYVDDFNIAYPAGVTIDLGNLDLWADGLPVAPTIATMPSLGGVWDELQANHNITGSFGAIANETLSNTDVTQAKVDTL